MESEFLLRVEKYAKAGNDAAEEMRRDMGRLRHEVGLTLEEISELAGIEPQRISAQEEGSVAADMEVIAPVLLIYYMLALPDRPQWLSERLERLNRYN